jgi:hypothetical protein
MSGESVSGESVRWQCGDCRWCRKDNHNWWLLFPGVGWIAWILWLIKPGWYEYALCGNPELPYNKGLVAALAARALARYRIDGRRRRVQKDFLYCGIARDFQNECGKDARFWEPKGGSVWK